MRLAYLTVANTFAALRFLPMTDREKDTEILVLPDRRNGIAGPPHPAGGDTEAMTSSD